MGSLDSLVVTPLLLWWGMHLAHPHDAERLAAFGLSIAERSDARKLLFHALTHANVEHLLQNSLVHVAASTSLQVPSAFSKVPRVVVGGWLMAGGALMGIWASMVDVERRTRQFQDRNDLGIPVLRSVLGSVHGSIAKRRVFCGGSAAIAALCGFNAGTQKHPVLMLMNCAMIAGDVWALLQSEPGLGLGLSSPSAPAVAHAAHVGGFIFGFAVAKVMEVVNDTIVERRRGRRLGG